MRSVDWRSAFGVCVTSIMHAIAWMVSWEFFPHSPSKALLTSRSMVPRSKTRNVRLMLRPSKNRCVMRGGKCSNSLMNAALVSRHQ